MSKKSNLLKTLALSVFCLAAALCWNTLTAEAYTEGDAYYYEQYGIGADEGYKYTSDDEWVPEGLEKKVIQDSKLDDNHSIVYIIMADGFTEDEKAQFESEAKAMMEYLMHLCPYSEFQDVTRAYTVFTPSNESGASRDMSYDEFTAAYEAYKAEHPDTKEVDLNSESFLPKDTFFRCSFNQLSVYTNYERLLEPSCAGMQRAADVAEAYVPEYDQIIVISNSERYGGSGISTVWPSYDLSYSPKAKEGFYYDKVENVNMAVSSINSASKEVAAHEIAHALGNLADEYWPGEVFATEDSPNMTQNSDPETVKWNEFLEYSERTNVGIYQYNGYGDAAADSWYRPSNKACKMEALSYPERTEPVFYEFCEVCREGFRENMSKFANCTTIHWQDYCKNSTPAVANQLVYGDDSVLDYLEYPTLDGTGYETVYTYTGSAPEDLEQSFIVLHDGEILDNAEITFTYYAYGNDEALGEAPSEPGEYTVVASYTGNGTTNSCEVTKSYSIEEEKEPVLEVVYKGKSTNFAASGEPIDMSSFFTLSYNGAEPDILFEGYYDSDAGAWISYENYSDKLYGTEDGYTPIAKAFIMHYYDADGNELDYIPSEPGSYSVSAEVPDITADGGTCCIYVTWTGNNNTSEYHYYYAGAESEKVSYKIQTIPEPSEDMPEFTLAADADLEDPANIVVDGGTDMSEYFALYVDGEMNYYPIIYLIGEDNAIVEYGYLRERDVAEAFTMSYYKANEDGSKGEKVDGIPSDPGTYVACATFSNSMIQVYTTGWNKYTVLEPVSGEFVYTVSGDVIDDPDEPVEEDPGQDTPGTEDPGQDTPGTEDPGQDTPGTEDPGQDASELGQTQNGSQGNASGSGEDTTDTSAATDTAVKTGDTAPVALYIVLIAVCGLAIAAVILVRRKNSYR